MRFNLAWNPWGSTYPPSRRWLRILAGLAIVEGWTTALLATVLAAVPGFGPVHAQEPVAVDFRAEIWPILQDHCIRCHGPEKQKGQLRLDRREFAAAGGHTGNSVLAVPAESSELFRRVTSDDPKYRMPANSLPLDAAQIESLRRWIAGGALWPIGEEIAAEFPPKYRLVMWLEPFFSRVEIAFGYIKPIAIPLVALLVAMLLIEHAKHRQRISRSEAVAAEGLALVPREWYLVGGLTLALAGLWNYEQQRQLTQNQTLEELRGKIAELESQGQVEIRHGPNGGPIPPRPKHPKRLGGTYYRGNDERDPRLFNGGFYRTATMQVYLSDAGHRRLAWGDSVGDGPLYVTLEIERANEATPALFTDELMGTIFLSRQVAMRNRPEGADTPAQFEKVDPGGRWAAHYPIGRPDGDRLEGMIYVYKGRMVDGSVDGKFHYGISYDVRMVDGRVSSESELWMGSLSVPEGLIIPPPDRMVLNEWFDFRPLPEIEGENSKDPALLGIPEYTDK